MSSPSSASFNHPSTDYNDDERGKDNEEPFLAISEDLVQSPAHKRAGIAGLDFDGLLSPPLQLHEDLKEGCGGQLWPAGMVLARYLLRRKKEEFAGKSIVELGAGGGLVGLAIAQSIAHNKNPTNNNITTNEPTIYITDQAPMLPLMHRNIALNDLSSHVHAAIYDWGGPPPSDIPSSPDIVLAADCVYFEPAFPLLQTTLRDLVGERTECYFCFKKRRRADLGFLKSVRKGFDVVAVDDDPEKGVYERESIFLYKITKKWSGTSCIG